MGEGPVRFPHGEPVRRLRGHMVLDPYSQERVATTWDNPEVLDLGPCGIYRSASTEPIATDRNAVTSDFDIYTEAEVDVIAGDRLEFRGLLCEVIGRPEFPHHPMTGWEPGGLIQAKIVEG